MLKKKKAESKPKGKIFIRVNDYKTEDRHPDYRGTVQIPYEMLEEVAEENCKEYKGTTYVMFDFAIWEGEEDYSMGTVELQQPKEEKKPKKNTSFMGGSRGKAQKKLDDDDEDEHPF